MAAKKQTKTRYTAFISYKVTVEVPVEGDNMADAVETASNYTASNLYGEDYGVVDYDEQARLTGIFVA